MCVSFKCVFSFQSRQECMYNCIPVIRLSATSINQLPCEQFYFKLESNLERMGVVFFCGEHILQVVHFCAVDLYTTRIARKWEAIECTVVMAHYIWIGPTVRMDGVTKAQQILQNLFGWNPIIISMSSQNLCNPATEIGVL